MNRRFCRILLILALGMCIACLPAAAAHSGQSGPASSGDSSPGSGNSAGSQATYSAGSSAASTSGSSDTAPGSQAGSQSVNTEHAPDNSVSLSGSPFTAPGGSTGTASQSPVASGPERGDIGDRAGVSADGAGLGSTDGSPAEAGTSGDDTGRASAATPVDPASSRGKQGSGQGSFPEPMAGSTGGTSGDSGNRGPADAGQGRGSAAGNGAGSPAGMPGAREEIGGPGRFAVAIGSAGAAGAARAGYGGDSGMIPGPGSGRGPSPQRQQQGPPAQSGAYPCGPAQTTPLPPLSGQAGNESKEEHPPRNRSRWIGLLFRVTEPSAPGTAPSDPPLPSLFPFGFLLFGGYRRISKKNVLEHDARQSIYETITRLPGIDTITLTDMTGINENTLRYHLSRLVATGRIASLARPGIVRYFPNQGAYSPFEHLVLHYLWTDTPREILWLLHAQPGLTRQQIADTIAISGPSVTRQMEHLIGDRIVENRLTGRSNHYYLAADAALTISRLMMSAPVPVHGEAGAGTLTLPAG